MRWEFEYELPEDAFGGTFDLDIVGFRRLMMRSKLLSLTRHIKSNIEQEYEELR